MKAIQIRQHGGPEVLEVVDAELREPESNEAVVRIAAAGVNFIEIYQRTGLYPVQLPFTPGQEAAGIVPAIAWRLLVSPAAPTPNTTSFPPRAWCAFPKKSV